MVFNFVYFLLPLLLIAWTRSALTQLSVDIQSLYSETVRTSDAQSKSQAESQESFHAISRRIDSIEEIHRNTEHSTKLLQDLCLSLSAKPITETPQRPTQMKSAGWGKTDSNTSSSAWRHRSQSVEKELTGRQELAFEESPLAIPIIWQQGRSLDCPSDCKCSCHVQQNMQAFSNLGNILGRLFLAYSGLSMLRKPCNIPTCPRQNATSIRLTYFFPRWFLNIVVSTTFSTIRLGTPSLNLKVRKIVPETNRLFALCMVEGVDGIQQLFASREASPDDIHFRGGWTPMHVSYLCKCSPKRD